MADPRTTSVVIPAFNEAAVIGQVVAGLASVAHWHEIIVVDDGSTDETRARGGRRAPPSSRIRTTKATARR